MSNENLDKTNKLIKPEDTPTSDDDIIRQLSENLQDVSPEDLDAMCDEMDEIKRREEEQNIKIICSVDWSEVIYDKENGVVTWNWISFQVKWFVWVWDFMRKAIAAGIKPEQMMKIIRAIWY